MFNKIKYEIGTRVNVVYDPNDDKQPIYTKQKLGFVYQVKALDPTMAYYLPIGPKPLPFAGESDA